MTEDEKVDGPKIAAQILSRMPSSHREKLMKAIALSDPNAAKKIATNIVTFDDIAELTSQSIQVLIKEVDHYDLVVSLKLAKENVKAALFANMSARKKQVVEEDFTTLPPKKISEVEEAQKRITSKMDQLKTAGLIRSSADEEMV
ncbi:MAG: hypothetical protein J5J00_17565 [Deltaproteobacteria bacterium]|nr:hypothetical protein [Deltaproteobacteria bacterium]